MPVASFSDRHQEPQPGPSRRMRIQCALAWKCPFIFRGDLVPVNGKVFLDVEKITLKKLPGEMNHTEAAATVAIVNKEGILIFWGFHKKK